MEVKDLKEGEPSKRVAAREDDTRVSRQRGIGALASSRVPLPAEPVSLEMAGNSKKQTNETRTRANTVINIINVAHDTIHEIGRLVKSIRGIAEQAQRADFPDQRRPVLEAEANQLVDEIKRKAQVAASGVKPLAGDEIQLEVDGKVSPTVKVKLSASASVAFGLGKIELDRPESIGSVHKAVAEAQKQVEALSSAISDAQAKVQDTLGALEVAAQNSEASHASLRDVDEALNLAASTGSQIGKYPDDALHSVGHIDRDMLNLLNN